MSGAQIVTLVAAFLSGFSAVSVFLKAAWVVEPLVQYGVPRSWWNLLGTAKAAGSVGLLVGLAVPPIGIAAAVGLVLYFTGAVVTVLKARSWSHVAFPIIYAAPAAAALVLGF
ncbi:DoxX family protein [Streptomyces sp. NPDC093225]|uniref:DoxX family protein n=1 Tax=Streptomyces sp. NPDC093225 TaxID=3366034 RepID=UPI0037F41442